MSEPKMLAEQTEIREIAAASDRWRRRRDGEDGAN